MPNIGNWKKREKMRKTKITVAIITKDEERQIKLCIECVTGWADEVLVIDGYSSDKTVSIAGEAGAKVILHKWEGGFAEERNQAMTHASGDWVLHIDADDRVTEAFKRAVDDIIDNGDNVDVYKFRRRNFFLGHCMRHGGWCHYIPNFVRRKKVTYEGALHERPVFDGKMGIIDADIEHYPFDSIEQFISRHNRYSSVEAAEMFEHDGTSRVSEVKRNAVGRTLKIFWKMYVKKKGYREGFHGLVFSVLFSLTNFLIWMKYWELCEKSKNKS